MTLQFLALVARVGANSFNCESASLSRERYELREKTIPFKRVKGLIRYCVAPSRSSEILSKAFEIKDFGGKCAQTTRFLLGCALFLYCRPVSGKPFSELQAASAYRMATEKELSDFLEDVERRAFRQAMFAVRKDEEALDIVQDAMIRLAEKYGDKPAAELPLLFQRILQNAIHDYFRREKVRNTWVSLFSNLTRESDAGEDFDLLEVYEAEEGTQATESAADKIERSQVLAAIDEAIQKLPARQREAFLMRYWEDMDVAETAAAMGCSEGSVKTHCSRATHALAQTLKAKGIYL